MSNVLYFRKNEADGNLADEIDVRLKSFGLLIPVVRHMREMGLSDSEIGRFFKFLGHEFCATALIEDEKLPTNSDAGSS